MAESKESSNRGDKYDSHTHLIPHHPMAPTIGVDTVQIREKALADLLAILEGVHHPYILIRTPVQLGAEQLMYIQVRGKKTLVLDQSLSGSIGLFAKFSVLQV